MALPFRPDHLENAVKGSSMLFDKLTEGSDDPDKLHAELLEMMLTDEFVQQRVRFNNHLLATIPPKTPGAFERILEELTSFYKEQLQAKKKKDSAATTAAKGQKAQKNSKEEGSKTSDDTTDNDVVMLDDDLADVVKDGGVQGDMK